MPAPRIDTTIEGWKRQAEFQRACKACGADLYFIRSRESDKLIPYTEAGISHFEDCPNASDFSKSSDLHKCAIGTCGEQIPKSRAFCIWHWRKVEPATQEALTGAYRAKNRQVYLAALKLAVEQASPKKKAEPKKEKPAQGGLFGDHRSTVYGVD